MLVSLSQLIFPLSESWSLYFTHKTKRKSASIGVDKWNELTLFCVVVMWFYIRTNWEKYDETVPFAHPDSSPQQLYVGAILWNSVNSNIMFTVMMAVLALNSWFKLLIRMQKTKTFGPQINMIVVMFEDLLQFMVFWTLILCFFTCVSTLVLG